MVGAPPPPSRPTTRSNTNHISGCNNLRAASHLLTAQKLSTAKQVISLTNVVYYNQKLNSFAHVISEECIYDKPPK